MHVTSFIPQSTPSLALRTASLPARPEAALPSVASDSFQRSQQVNTVKQAPPAPQPSGNFDEVVSLTQALVRVNSGPGNLIPGENAVADVVEGFANENGLQVERYETVRGRPMIVVTLPGTRPELGTVGFVHHSDVTAIKGEWKLGEPFSGDITTDRHGRQVMVGRGTIDTKGPAAQVLVAMKHLKENGRVPERTTQLFLFPDEETGGREGAWYLAQNHPEKFEQVRYWVVEGAGIMSKETLQSVGDIKTDVPFLAVAQKYSIPVQVVLKNPADPQQAIEKGLEALARLDDYVEDRDWTFLGNDEETGESFDRFGETIGGFKGWLLKNLWWTGFVQDRMGAELSATNRTDMARTDFYLSSNPNGDTAASNTKPSSATAILELNLDKDDQQRAVELIGDAVGEKFEVEVLEQKDEKARVRLTLPQSSYDGTHHGSIPDRERDAIDVTNRALESARKKLWWRGWAEKMEVVDYYTNKSPRDTNEASREPVRAHMTLDLRVASDEQSEEVLTQLQAVLGEDFELRRLGGPEETDAYVRRLSFQSPLFQAAEEAIHDTYGDETPVLFGNTTASNDVRYLMEANPESEALTFVPVLYTENGAHGPDEAVTIDSLKSGTEWTARFMELVGNNQK